MTKTDYFAAALLLAVFGAYSLGLGGPLLFDDHVALTANPLVQIDGAVFDEWRRAALSSGSGPLGRPIAMLSFALNHALAGELSPAALKLVNVLIHVAVGALIYALAIPLFARLYPGAGRGAARWLALLAAAIWLLHPLHVSTVLYAVQRMAQLAALFAVAGLLVFVRYRQRWALRGAGPGEVAAAGLWLLLLTACAALSKENGAVLLPLIAVVEVCFFGGVWAGREVPLLRRGAAAAVALYLGVLLLCMIVPPDFLAGRFGSREFTLHERVLTQARVLWHYLAWLALPDISAMGFQHDDIPLSTGPLSPPATLAAIAGWALALGAAILLRRRVPLLLFALLFYLVGHSLESTVWPLEMVYEHRNYLPVIGYCLLFASLLAAPLWRADSAGLPARALVVAVPVLLLALLLVRVDTWSDTLRLAGVNVGNHPESSRSHYFYANELLKRYRRSSDLGLSEEEARAALLGARVHFERMYETNPRDVAALVMLHSLDSQYAADAPGRIDWLAELERLLESRVLQASDMNALVALIDCLNAGGCAADRERILGLLDRLDERYPDSLTLLGWRYTYLMEHAESPEQLERVLDRALALDPGRPEFLYRRIQHQAREEDVGGMYETVRQLLLHDERRLRLGQLQELFIMGEPAPEAGP